MKFELLTLNYFDFPGKSGNSGNFKTYENKNQESKSEI